MQEGNDQRDFEGESDARTLNDAHQVRKDPKRHKKAMGHLKKMGKQSTHAQDTQKFEQGNAQQQQPQPQDNE